MSTPRFVAATLLGVVTLFFVSQAPCAAATDTLAGKPGVYPLSVGTHPPSEDPNIDYVSALNGSSYFISVPAQYDPAIWAADF